MKTIRLTKDDFKDYKYVGKTDLTNYEDYNVEIDGNLGWVMFEKGIYVNGYIRAKAGTGIKAGTDIEADWDIKAGWGIKAGRGIKAGTDIEAGWGIKAGTDIEAGWGIKAGTDIEAGEGITAGLYISCKLTLSWTANIFAGVCWWRKADEEEKKITCGKAIGGTVAYGTLIETGLPEEKDEEVENAIRLLERKGVLKDGKVLAK